MKKLVKVGGVELCNFWLKRCDVWGDVVTACGGKGWDCQLGGNICQ